VSHTNRILIVRPDRLGDVILSTPVIDAVRKNFPESKIGVLVRQSVAPLLQSHPSVDWVLTYRPKTDHARFSGLLKLSDEIQRKNFGCAIVLQAQFTPSAAVWMAGVPIRIGPLSKWYSRWLYNEGLRQHRSESDRNEADYNLELAARAWGGSTPTREEFPVRVTIEPLTLEYTRKWLANSGLPNEGKRFVAIHPGMGGSARNWPIERYEELIQRLVSESIPVVVTMGPADHALLLRLRSKFTAEIQNHHVVLFEGEGQPVTVLGGVLAQASVVVAPSTGPLHLAAALGRPTVGFYPPIRVQSAKRWGPFVKSSQAAPVFSPQVECPAGYRCLGPKCRHFDCMASLTVGDALVEIRKHV
jgi:ADP-heptose:LPS heptosyltransferase